MAISVIKISQMPMGGNAQVGDEVAGIRSGLNYQINGQSTTYTPLPSVMVTTLTQQLATNTCYVTNNAGLITLTLPQVFNFGDIIEIIGFGAGGWQIAQNIGQQIFVGGIGTTSGVDGFIASSQAMDSIILKGIVPNTTFVNVGGPQGNLNWN